MEAKAVELALQFARDVGISDFIMEGDSLIVHNALCGISPPPSLVAGALGFYGMFRQVNFSHIRRQGNKPAHLLTKHAKCIVDYVAWIEETPCFLMQALTHDVSISI